MLQFDFFPPCRRLTILERHPDGLRSVIDIAETYECEAGLAVLDELLGWNGAFDGTCGSLEWSFERRPAQRRVWVLELAGMRSEHPTREDAEGAAVRLGLYPAKLHNLERGTTWRGAVASLTEQWVAVPDAGGQA